MTPEIAVVNSPLHHQSRKTDVTNVPGAAVDIAAIAIIGANKRFHSLTLNERYGDISTTTDSDGSLLLLLIGKRFVKGGTERRSVNVVGNGKAFSILRQRIATHPAAVSRPNFLTLLNHQCVTVPICLGQRFPLRRRYVRHVLFSIGNVEVRVAFMHHLKSRFQMLDFVTVTSERALRSRFTLAEIEFPCAAQVWPDLLSRDVRGARAEKENENYEDDATIGR